MIMSNFFFCRGLFLKKCLIIDFITIFYLSVLNFKNLVFFFKLRLYNDKILIFWPIEYKIIPKEYRQSNEFPLIFSK